MIQTASTLDDLRLRPHWSYSAVNQFLRICPAQFAFQRIWKLKPAFVTESLPFGSAFHRTAEIFWHKRAEGGDASADMLADLFARVWRREVSVVPAYLLSDHDLRLLGHNVLPTVRADRMGRTRTADRGRTIAWKPAAGIASPPGPPRAPGTTSAPAA